MKDYAGTLLMVSLTTLVGIACYATTARGANERVIIEKMRREIVSDTRAIRGLQVELRTRARLPQLERWNDQVLKMSAPAAGQFMRSPVQLISLVMPQKPMRPEAPVLRFALAPAEPTSEPKVVQAKFELEERPASLVRAAYPETSADSALGEP